MFSLQHREVMNRNLFVASISVIAQHSCLYAGVSRSIWWCGHTTSMQTVQLQAGTLDTACFFTQLQYKASSTAWQQRRFTQTRLSTSQERSGRWAVNQNYTALSYTPVYTIYNIYWTFSRFFLFIRIQIQKGECKLGDAAVQTATLQQLATTLQLHLPADVSLSDSMFIKHWFVSMENLSILASTFASQMEST